MLDAFRHNAWATRELIDYCRKVDPAHLGVAAPGVFGTVLETLRHMLTGESGYSARFTGSPRAWDLPENATPTLEELDAWNREMGSVWEEVLAAGVDGDAILTRKRSDGAVSEMTAGLMLAQALHHSNVHREQISAVLTGLGLTPPDISGWAYGRETGRYRTL
jgi:uncharacterized damage-inducible protein DinB